jgi:hypothetical protein
MEELEALKPGPVASKRNVERFQKTLDEIRRSYQERDIPERQALFESIFQEVVWHGEYLVAVFRGGDGAGDGPRAEAGGGTGASGPPSIPPGLRLESGPMGKPEACTEEGCKDPIHARLLCRNHYCQAMSGGGKLGHTAPGKGKLTERQREEIRGIYRSGGVSYRDLGRIFGVSQVAARKICLD